MLFHLDEMPTSAMWLCLSLSELAEITDQYSEAGHKGVDR
jgi:hypothetical protein